MSGRIRSLKPEWLEDEFMLLASSDARVLSIGLILLADDYGNGRAHPDLLASRIFPGVPGVLASALAELVAVRFVTLYELDGQHYFSIRNWDKHQRVDKPGKPKVPQPSATPGKVIETPGKVPEDSRESRASRASLPLLSSPDQKRENPEPIPTEPSSLDEALRMPLADRARYASEHWHAAEWLEPGQWPEVRAVAESLARALGQPETIGNHKDRGVRCVVDAFAAGSTLEELLAVANSAKTDRWWQSGSRGLTSLTPEVIRRSSTKRGGSEESELGALA